jgi:hypothetical protein
MKYSVEMTLSGVIYIWNFMTISSGIQVILNYNLNSSRGCSIDIIDGRDLWRTPLRWPQEAWNMCQLS